MSVCCVYTALKHGSGYYRVGGWLLMDGQTIAGVDGDTRDPDHDDYKTGTGAAVVACAAGAAVYVDAPTWDGNSVWASRRLPRTTFSGFLL